MAYTYLCYSVNKCCLHACKHLLAICYSIKLVGQESTNDRRSRASRDIKLLNLDLQEQTMQTVYHIFTTINWQYSLQTNHHSDM